MLFYDFGPTTADWYGISVRLLLIRLSKSFAIKNQNIERKINVYGFPTFVYFTRDAFRFIFRVLYHYCQE